MNGVMRMAEEQKESFVFYKSFIEAAEELPEERRWNFIKGIAEYAFDGKDPEFTGLEKMAFIIIRRSMDSSYKRYKASVENGKKGGNPNFKKGQSNPYYKKKADDENGKKITQDNLTDTITDTGTVTKSKQSLCSVTEERAPMGAPPPRKQNELTPEQIAMGWKPVVE